VVNAADAQADAATREYRVVALEKVVQEQRTDLTAALGEGAAGRCVIILNEGSPTNALQTATPAPAGVPAERPAVESLVDKPAAAAGPTARPATQPTK
jgi:hypothetical protein